MAGAKFVTVQLSDIFLDNENPRHDPIDAEPDIIARLLAREKITRIARSIAEHGPSPLERLAVIPHPKQKGKYTVVEGNRRLCALKLLKDPRRAQNASARKTFEKLGDSGVSIPSKLEVALFANRKDARYWLSLRHEGEQDGVGTRNWKAPEKARFNTQGSPTSNPNAQALALIEYSQKEGVITEADRAEVSLTTVTRYLSNPVVRSTFGLTNNRDLTIDVEQEEFDTVVGAFLADVASGKANSRTSSDDRKKYAVGLQKRGVAPRTRLTKPVLAVPDALKKRAKKARTSRHPNNRPYIVTSDFKLTSKNNILRRIFEELRSLDPDSFPFAGGYLLRAFVEKIAFEFAKQRGRGTNGKKLKDVINICCAELQKDGVSDRELKPLLVMASSVDHPTSPDTLGASVHGTLIPVASSLKARWEELSPGLTLMLQRMQ